MTSELKLHAMAKVYIDNIEFEVPDGKNMLEVCLSLGMDLTYFCWHPAMHSVGACRQCAVMHYKDEQDTRGRIAMACMLDANDGTRISLGAQAARDFRAGNIEALMINHPHDCPVCDEGGECHLQDMTVMSGHNYRRYRFNKRTHVNQDLGPFIYHEMNRCIQCYRCTRFYNDYAGGQDFGVFASSGRVYFGRSEPGTLESEFSGNLVEVCPTGVFTDKTLRKHYTRKWDLTSAPSICQQCSVGCNTLASERYGGLRRIMSRYNGDVNGYFICDRGRFGYEYVNSESRLTRAAAKIAEPGRDAFALLREHLATKPDMVGIGSPRASLESNFMLRKLVGPENFYYGIPSGEAKAVAAVLDVLQNYNIRTPSLKEIESYDTVLVLGEDVTNTAPMIALALRQAALTLPRQKALDLKIQEWNDAAIREVIQDEKGPFFVAAPYATKLDELATYTYHGGAARLVSIAAGIAAAIGGSADEADSFVREAAAALSKSQKPLIVSGTGMMSPEVVYAAAEIAAALGHAGKNAGIVLAVPEANSLGLAMTGGAGSLDDLEQRIGVDSGTTAIVLETNLAYRMGAHAAAELLGRCASVVMLDAMENETTALADFVLPAGTFAESDGTFVNNEGRAQRYYQVFKPDNDMQSGWAWLDMMLRQALEPRTFDEIVGEMTQEMEAFSKISGLAPDASFRIGTQKIPRQTHRYSGRTAMRANVSVHEPKPPTDPDSPLSYTMEGFHGNPPPPDIPFFWSPGWNSVQSINKYQIEVGGPLHGGNPGIRLIEPGNGTSSGNKKEQHQKGNGSDVEVLPQWFIYGSGELSALSGPVAKRIPPAAACMSSKTHEKLGVGTQAALRVQDNTHDFTIRINIDETVPESVVLLPYGFPQTAGVRFPFQGHLSGASF